MTHTYPVVMALPTFLVLGTAKAATTALYTYLRAHPEVYMTPQKETHFFAFRNTTPDFRGPTGEAAINQKAITSLDTYRRQYEEAEQYAARGEACPTYLYDPRAAPNIRQIVPEAKLIVMLRHPVERAYSHYLFHVLGGTEPLDTFEDVLADEPRRVRENWSWVWHIKRIGLYHRQLTRYFEAFPRQQIRVYLYKDFRADPSRVLTDIYDFIGVDPTFTPDLSRRPNRSGVPENRWLHALLVKPNIVRSVAQALIPDRLRLAAAAALERRMRRRMKRPEMSPEVRADLVDFYRDDVLKTQDLLQRDLSHWLK